MKKFVFMVILLLCASLPIGAYAETDIGLTDLTPECLHPSECEEEMYDICMLYWKNHDISSDNFISLLESFGCSHGMLEAEDYPEHYGGGYIDRQGNMVLFTTGDIDEAKKDFAERIGNEFFTVEKVRHSFRKLKGIMDTIYAYTTENPDCETVQNIRGYAIFDAENYIVVGLKELSQERIDEFRKIAPYDCFRFAQFDGIALQGDVGDFSLFSPPGIPPIFTPENVTDPYVWIISAIIVFLCGTAAIIFFKRARFVRAMQTSNGDVLFESTFVSEKQVVAAIEESAKTPSDEVYKSLAAKIENARK
jgi:hypothetical protein